MKTATQKNNLGCLILYRSLDTSKRRRQRYFLYKAGNKHLRRCLAQKYLNIAIILCHVPISQKRHLSVYYGNSKKAIILKSHQKSADFFL